MGFISKLLDYAMEKYLAKHGAHLIEAMDKVNNGGTIDDVDTIARDYFYLLKSVRGGKAPNNVEIMEDDHSLLLVDGVVYDFDVLIPHRDKRNTGRKMEIEVLFSDDSFLTVIQERLNAMVKNQW